YEPRRDRTSLRPRRIEPRLRIEPRYVGAASEDRASICRSRVGGSSLDMSEPRRRIEPRRVRAALQLGTRRRTILSVSRSYRICKVNNIDVRSEEHTSE